MGVSREHLFVWAVLIAGTAATTTSPSPSPTANVISDDLDDDWNIYTGSGSVTSWVVSIIFFTFWFVAHLYSWFDTDP